MVMAMVTSQWPTWWRGHSQASGILELCEAMPWPLLLTATFPIWSPLNSDNLKPGWSDGSFTTSCLALVATLVAVLVTTWAWTSRLQREHRYDPIPGLT